MKEILNSIKENKLIILISIITTVIFFHEQILGNSFFWDDFVEYVYPTQTFAARESGLFNIPFWNPYSFNGMPFFADLQVGFFYPLHRILNLFISDDGTLPISILQLIIILHFIISQINTYSLSRSLGISKEASIFSAISYSFSLIMVVHVIHPMMIYHLTWFPLILNLFRQGIVNSNFKYSIWSGLILGFTMLSGHPQSTLYVSFFLFLFAIYSILSDRSNIGKKVLNAFIPILIAGGLFAVQYLPSSELASLSERDENTYELVSEGSLHLKQAATMIMPEIFGKISGNSQENVNTFFLKFDDQYQIHFYWETSFYFGILTFIFAIFSLLKGYKNNLILFLFGISIFALLYSFGSNFFLHKLFYNLPLFDTFRNPGRILFFITLAFSLLAGFGLDMFTKKDLKLILIPIVFAVITMFLGKSGFFFANENLPQDIIENISSSININLAIIISGSILLFVLSYIKIKREYFIYIFTLISFVDLYIAGVEFNQSPTNPKEKYTLNSELKNIFKVNPPDEIFRVNMRMYNPSYMAMNRSQGMIDKIMLVEGYNPLLLKRPVPRLSDKERIHDILNVKYEIGIDRKMNQPRFYERFERFNHVWATNKIKTIYEESILEEIIKTDDNFREITWLEETPKINLNSDSLEFKFNIKEYSNDEISLITNSNTNSMMVLSEIFFPAWKAYVDGTETKIFRADFALRTIELPAGNHEVVFKYESSSFFTGGMISLITLFSSLILLIFYKN